MEDETWSLGQKLISVSSWAVGLRAELIVAWTAVATGFRVVTSRFGFCPSSSRGWLAIVRGRRFGSGFKTMCDGMPP